MFVDGRSQINEPPLNPELCSGGICAMEWPLVMFKSRTCRTFRNECKYSDFSSVDNTEANSTAFVIQVLILL
jgi:hypothetical protein